MYSSRCQNQRFGRTISPVDWPTAAPTARISSLPVGSRTTRLCRDNRAATSTAGTFRATRARHFHESTCSQRHARAATRSSASAARRTSSTASGCSACCSSTATSWSTTRAAPISPSSTRAASSRRPGRNRSRPSTRCSSSSGAASCAASSSPAAWPSGRRNRCWKRRPGIDHLVGVFGREEVTKVADRLLGGLDRAADRVPPGADAPAARHGPAADHAAALRVSEDLRRLRPAVHVLRDPARCAASTTRSRWKKSWPRPASWPPTACASW